MLTYRQRQQAKVCLIKYRAAMWWKKQFYVNQRLLHVRGWSMDVGDND